MKHMLLAAAAALALGSAPAFAAKFDLALSGSGTHWSPSGVPGCDYSIPGNPCIYGFSTEDWTGAVHVTTSSTVDGTYSYGAGLEALQYTSNADQFTYTEGDSQTVIYGQFEGGTWLAGLVPGASVTVQGGRAIAIDAAFIWDSDNPITFGGLSISDLNGGEPGQPDADYWSLSGTLTPVPEMPTIALFALGVGMLALKRTAPCAGRRSRRLRSR